MNAVELSYSRANIRQLAYELDIRLELIYRWRSEFENYQGTSFTCSGKAKLTKEESEVSRLTKELKARVILISRPRVARLMKKANMRSVTKKKFVVTLKKDQRVTKSEWKRELLRQCLC